MQKNGAGLHSASSCFWDSSTDGRTLTFLGNVILPIAPILVICSAKQYFEAHT